VRKKSKHVDLDIVAERLDRAKRPQNGRLAFEGTAFRTATSALLTALEFAAEIHDSGRQEIVRSALFSLEPSLKITSKAILAAAARTERDYLARNERRFALLTSVSMKFSERLRPIVEGRVRITFSRSLPTQFDRSVFHDIPAWPARSDVDDYAKVIVRIDARTNLEAFERALRELDYYRGIWNYVLTRHTISRDTSQALPHSDIALGPLQTIHAPHGSGVGGTFLYQPAFYPQPAIVPDAVWSDVCESVAFVRRQRRKSRYSSLIKEMFVRYARELDGVDFDSTYLKLWSLLELLTGINNGRYDQLVQRAVSVCEEQRDTRAMLEHLREYRNASVHEGFSTDLVQDLCWQLKYFVDALINFHLSWSGEFESLAESVGFLDLPREASALRKRILLARRALHYRGG